MRVLVAEDDAGLRSVLDRGLRENGYVVDAVADGHAAASHLRAYEYEVAVVDWRMPGLSGVDVVADARRQGIHTPVLMLTARDTTSDRISGLNSGADDYLVKPFDFGELLARLRALQRRPAVTIAPRLSCGDLVFDPEARQVTVDDRPIPLTATEMGPASPVSLRRDPPGIGTPRVGSRGGRRRVQHHRRARRETAGQAQRKPGPDRDGAWNRVQDRVPLSDRRHH